jgi:pimeloyl-ACP methyl ester carboxylesterase
VKDAQKIFDYLHDSLGFKNIYFIGHSEGSLIGMLASEKKKVSGYISVAGAGRPIDEILNEQMQKQPLPDSVKQQIPVIFNQLKKGQEVDKIPSDLNMLFRKSIQPYLISWLKYSPQEEIKKLRCPILILQGGCDIQVTEPDAKNLHEANKKSTLDIIPNMSHTLKNAGKDCVDQTKTYTDGSMLLDQILVKDIANFIKQ